MTITWQAEDTVEPIADTTIEGIANFNNYSVTSGCGLTYSAANMTVTVAAGTVLHNGSTVTVAGNTVTLVSDATNPRWTWIGVPSTGTAAIVSGTAAATPTVPEIGDYVPLALVYVQANLAIANNATWKLDKRVLYAGLKSIMTTSGDMVYASAANTPARLAKGTANQALLMNSGATAPAWGASLQSLMTGTGDIVYSSSANTPARLAAGSNSQVLTLASGIPSWATPTSSEWVKVSAGTFNNATNVSFTSLSGYKRYRATIQALTNYSVGFYVTYAQVNGVTAASNYISQTIYQNNTSAPTYYANPSTGNFAISSNTATALGFNQATINFQFEIENIGGGGSQNFLTATWKFVGIGNGNNNCNNTVGGGMTQFNGPITQLDFNWGYANSTTYGIYLLEGSNS